MAYVIWWFILTFIYAIYFVVVFILDVNAKKHKDAKADKALRIVGNGKEEEEDEKPKEVLEGSEEESSENQPDGGEDKDVVIGTYMDDGDDSAEDPNKEFAKGVEKDVNADADVNSVEYAQQYSVARLMDDSFEGIDYEED